MSEHIHAPATDAREDEIDRWDTVLRILLTVLFAIVVGVLEAVLGLIIVFELIVALVTRRAPSPRVRELANRIVAYYYRIGRYLTYNESHVPFPFSDFPQAVEGDAWRSGETESKAMGLPRREVVGDADVDADDA